MTLSLSTVKQRFLNKSWNSEDNKNLLNIVNRDQLDLEPACIYGLDQLGLNHLEIINLSQSVGKRLLDIPTADLDFLNILQEKYGCVFNYEEKSAYHEGRSKRLPEYSKLNGYVSQPSGDYWLCSSALLKLSTNYN